MEPEPRSGTRAGHVALVGRPNVGKSTLLNALVGEKLSIVTSRAQTTRDRIFGIATTPDAQIIFVDTPGLLDPKYKLQQAMLETALAAVADADVVLLLLDATRPQELPAPDIIQELTRKGDSLLVTINKIDQSDGAGIADLQRWSVERLRRSPLRCSALTGEGLDVLRTALLEHLPLSPFLYPEDDLAVQPVRFFVAELVRETIFEQYAQEVPYATVVRIEDFREEQDPVYISATVFVERDSQKGIILGKNGSAIRELGRSAREKIEQFIGRSVYLDLWVKSMPGWRNKASSLRFLGYPVPKQS